MSRHETNKDLSEDLDQNARIAVAPNVFVHSEFVPGDECMYAFNIDPPDFGEPKLVVINDEEISTRNIPFMRRETVFYFNFSTETEYERITIIENRRNELSQSTGVDPELIRVVEFSKSDAIRIARGILSWEPNDK